MTIYISFDVETTGPVPGLHSMVSFGAVVYDSSWCEVRSTETHIAQLYLESPEAWARYPERFPACGWDPSTWEWWGQPELERARSLTFGPPRCTPEDFGHGLCDWLERLAEDMPHEVPIVFVAYPAVFDWAFLSYYMNRFVPQRWKRLGEKVPDGSNDIGGRRRVSTIGCLDMLTLASAVLGKPYLEATKKNWPAEWTTEELPHTHVAIEDARSQGYTFVKMMQALEGMHRLPGKIE